MFGDARLKVGKGSASLALALELASGCLEMIHEEERTGDGAEDGSVVADGAENPVGPNAEGVEFEVGKP